jgi:hypothetical protein
MRHFVTRKVISYEHPTRVKVALQCVAVRDAGGAIDADAARALAPRARVPVLHEHVPLCTRIVSVGTRQSIRQGF